jgi:uncharacterized protein (TIGR03905 family)
MYQYITQGTCSQEIHFNIDDEGRLHDVSFLGGCNGNLKAIGKLVEGNDAAMVMERLKGVQCGSKGTSCGDQFATAIGLALQKR